MRGLTRTCQRNRPRWCHWGALMGMGCRFYIGSRPQVIPCGITAGAVYESHTWRKGWPTVAPEVVSCTHFCVYEHGAVDVGVAYDKERPFAMHGHACRVLGLSSGLCRSGKRSLLHVRLRNMTWTRTCGVYSRTRSPTFTRDHLYVHADTGRPPRNIPVLSTILSRPHPDTHAARKSI